MCIGKIMDELTKEEFITLVDMAKTLHNYSVFLDQLHYYDRFSSRLKVNFLDLCVKLLRVTKQLHKIVLSNNTL